jgi:hypothetical protein
MIVIAMLLSLAPFRFRNTATSLNSSRTSFEQWYETATALTKIRNSSSLKCSHAARADAAHHSVHRLRLRLAAKVI